MSTESIIGITSGIIGIITGIVAFVKWIYPWIIKKYFRFPYAETFNHLMQKDLLDEKRRKDLIKLNKSPYFKDKIKEDYIQSFSLGKRGPLGYKGELSVCTNCMEAVEFLPTVLLRYQ